METMTAEYEYQEKLFQNLIDQGKLGHAYLFFGDPGIGKCAFTKRLASYLEFGSFGPESRSFLDARWFSRGDESSSLGIDSVRAIREFLYQTPLRSRFRLAVIDDAQVLTPEAQSALLKIVEEPPVHGLLIFIAEQEASLVPALLSRLQRFYFPRLSSQKMKERLEGHYGFSGKEAAVLAVCSFGRIGRALELGHQAVPVKEKEENPKVVFLNSLRERIAELHQQGVLKEHEVLSRLLRLEVALQRFSLNVSLQRKVASLLERG